MVSRRAVLNASAGVVVGTATIAAGVIPAAASSSAAPRRSAARDRPAATPSRSRVRATHRSVHGASGGRLHVPETGFPLTHLAVAWQGSPARVRLRTAIGWSGWRTVDGCAAGPDGQAQPHGGAVVLTAPGALGYEVRTAGTGSADITELNTADGPATLAAAAAAPAMPLPGGKTCSVPYLSRAAWGADESLLDFPPQYYPVQTITVHHTATGNNDPDPAATVRAIYYDQAVTKSWGDVGYHLFIDEAGRVYEARWSGSDTLPIFAPGSSGTVPPTMVTGAHVETYNSGNIGICLIGDFTSQQPTAAARETLVRLLSALTVSCALNPTGTTVYLNPVNGLSKTLDTIPGHRQWAATQCPGNLFYPELVSVRAEVARRTFTYRRRRSMSTPVPGTTAPRPIPVPPVP